MRSPDEIVALYHSRRLSRGPLFEAMMEIRDAYNGDLAVPLPELAKKEAVAVPNLFTQAIDQIGMRIASTTADVRFLPTTKGERADRAADLRRRVALGWWASNSARRKLRRRARWFLGYASAPVLLRPSAQFNEPRWFVRDPLTCFPAETDDPDDMAPDDCIFAYTRSFGWLARNYPDQIAMLERKKNMTPEDRLTMLEYVDDEQFQLLVLSTRAADPAVVFDTSTKTVRPRTPGINQRIIGTQYVMPLHFMPNRAGICTVVVPGRVTLDRPQGQLDNNLGMYRAQAMMFALEQIAVKRGVFPYQWLVGRQNENPQVVTYAQPDQGVMGRVKGGTIEVIELNPGYQTQNTINYLERNARVTGGIPPDLGGESGSNVRTARRGMDLISSTIDYTIQEAQEIFEEAQTHEFHRAIAIDKVYYKTQPKSYFVSWKGATGRVAYTPGRLWESDAVVVRYPFPGADVNDLVVGLGQRLGLGTMPVRRAMELDPMIDDVETSMDQIQAESLERAFMQALADRTAAGALDPLDIARIAMMVRYDKEDIFSAAIQVSQEAQERQSTTVNPAEPGSPEAQPGLAMPGEGEEAGVAIPEVAPGVQNLASTFRALYPAEAAGARAGAA